VPCASNCLRAETAPNWAGRSEGVRERKKETVKNMRKEEREE
jgi:hypothetical protein